MRVAAFRVSEPNRKATGFIDVNVVRNPTQPFFVPPFEFFINETQPLGDAFGFVTAQDPDTVSVKRYDIHIDLQCIEIDFF